MANQRKLTRGRNRQVIMGSDISGVSGKSKLFVERYLSNKGKYLMVQAKTRAEKDAVWAKYGKNRYRSNPDSKPLKVIFHRQLHTSEVM